MWMIIISIVLVIIPFSEERENAFIHAEHKFVSGRSVEYLPDPIFYDTYIPIIYKIPIPKHTDSALRLLWGDVQSCTKSKSGKLCPTAYHLFKVINQLGDDMGFWKPFYLNHTASKRESQKKRAGFEVVCNEIGPHFFRTYTSKAQLDRYSTALRACSRIGHQVVVRAPTENWVVDKVVYYQMLESFKKTYFNNLPTEGNVDWAIFLNAYTSVHGLLLTNHVMESVRLASALRICQSGLIPQTFVNIDLLTEALQSVSNILSKPGYQLVYANLAEDIEEYYKLPLADCTFSEDFTFVIRVLAPIRRVEVSHKLVEMSSIPFLEELSHTSGIPERLCRLRLPAPKLTLIETNTGLLLDTHCESNQLCKTSEVSTVFENDACTSSLLTEDRQLITHTCKLTCFSVNPIALPLIRRISSDTYVVVGSSGTKVHLNCFDDPANLIAVPMKNVGALRIKLACNCHLLYSNHVSYRPRYPCADKTLVEHVLPYHWYNSKLNATLEKYENKKETDTGEEDSVTETGENAEPYFDEKVEKVNNASIAEGSSNADQVEESQIEKSLEKQEEELERERTFVPKHEVVTRKVNSSESDGMVVQLAILWTLVIILACLTLYLGYHVRKLAKWREMQSYKDTRILYKIPETPDESKINRMKSGRTRVAWEAFYDLFTVH